MHNSTKKSDRAGLPIWRFMLAIAVYLIAAGLGTSTLVLTLIVLVTPFIGLLPTRHTPPAAAPSGPDTEQLAERMAVCLDEIGRLEAEIRDLNERRRKQVVARDRLAASRLADRADLFERAVDLLDAQIAARQPILRDWQALRTDLQALASANEAEAALLGFDITADLSRIEGETTRLAAATDELLAADEVAQTLSALR